MTKPLVKHFALPTKCFEPFEVTLLHDVKVRHRQVLKAGTLVPAEYIPNGEVYLFMPNPNSETQNYLAIVTDAKWGVDYELTCPVIKLWAMQQNKPTQLLEIHTGLDSAALLEALKRYKADGITVGFTSINCTDADISAALHAAHPQVRTKFIDLT